MHEPHITSHSGLMPIHFYTRKKTEGKWKSHWNPSPFHTTSPFPQSSKVNQRNQTQKHSWETDRQTDRDTDRQIERQERAWKEVVVVLLQTHSKEEKQEGMRERSQKTNPKRMARKKQWVVVLLCKWEMWVQDRQMRRKKGSREERGSRLQRSVAVTAAASERASVKQRFSGEGGRGGIVA